MLPFTGKATIQDQAGQMLATDVPVRLEEAGSNATRVGVAIDHVADVHVDAAGVLVGQVNRRLAIGGQTYKVISAVRYDFVPHLEVGLREIRGG